MECVDSLSATLRHETRAQHEWVENLSFSVRLAKGEIDLAEYALHLCVWLVFFEKLESALPEAPHPAPFRSALLRQDLEYLKETLDRYPGATNLHRSHGCSWKPDRAEWMGRCYVLEGSSLGALVLGPRLKKALDLPRDATHFYSDHVKGAKTQWRRVKSFLDAAPYSTDEIHRSIAAAKDTFRDVGAAFEQIGSQRSGSSESTNSHD
ncbi:MAG: biliverdin-producing heme oxygenase [Myxococcota bacterium]